MLGSRVLVKSGDDSGNVCAGSVINRTSNVCSILLLDSGEIRDFPNESLETALRHESLRDTDYIWLWNRVQEQLYFLSLNIPPEFVMEWNESPGSSIESEGLTQSAKSRLLLDAAIMCIRQDRIQFDDSPAEGVVTERGLHLMPFRKLLAQSKKNADKLHATVTAALETLRLLLSVSEKGDVISASDVLMQGGALRVFVDSPYDDLVFTVVNSELMTVAKGKGANVLPWATVRGRLGTLGEVQLQVLAGRADGNCWYIAVPTTIYFALGPGSELHNEAVLASRLPAEYSKILIRVFQIGKAIVDGIDKGGMQFRKELADFVSKTPSLKAVLDPYAAAAKRCSYVIGTRKSKPTSASDRDACALYRALIMEEKTYADEGVMQIFKAYLPCVPVYLFITDGKGPIPCRHFRAARMNIFPESNEGLQLPIALHLINSAIHGDGRARGSGGNHFNPTRGISWQNILNDPEIPVALDLGFRVFANEGYRSLNIPFSSEEKEQLDSFMKQRVALEELKITYHDGHTGYEMSAELLAEQLGFPLRAALITTDVVRSIQFYFRDSASPTLFAMEVHKVRAGAPEQTSHADVTVKPALKGAISHLAVTCIISVSGPVTTLVYPNSRACDWSTNELARTHCVRATDDKNCLLFDASLFHKGSANTSDQDSLRIVFTFVKPSPSKQEINWLKDCLGVKSPLAVSVDEFLGVAPAAAAITSASAQGAQDTGLDHAEGRESPGGQAREHRRNGERR